MKYFTDILEHANTFLIPHREGTILGSTDNLEPSSIVLKIQRQLRHLYTIVLYQGTFRTIC